MVRTQRKAPVLYFTILMLVTSANRWFAHGGEAPTTTYTTQQLRNLDVGPTCITSECHANLKQVRFRHGPTAQDKCDPCHQSVNGKHVFTAPTKGNALCLECHDPLLPGKIKHKPVGENCLECHDVHGANNRFFTRGVDSAELCGRCHEDVTKGLKFVHGPFAQGLCLACHEPHDSDNPNLLIAPPGQFCTICHEETAEDGKNAIVVHEQFNKDCGGCHSGHGSGQRYFLPTAEDELCKKCHEDEIDKARQFKFKHQPVDEKNQCSACHAPHFSDFEKLLKEASKPLCLDCHDRTYKDEKGKEIPNIKAELDASRFLHGPIRDNTCVPCHNAHGSDNIALLNRYFPPRFYAPFAPAKYELCFFCHDKNLVLEPQSLDTAFRNGEQNLHYLHVNREKGRTCRACHAEHASNNPVHIRDAVPYGRWVMEIDFEKTPTGGSCLTGCHARYSYDRSKPIENQTPGK